MGANFGVRVVLAHPSKHRMVKEKSNKIVIIEGNLVDTTQVAMLDVLTTKILHCHKI